MKRLRFVYGYNLRPIDTASPTPYPAEHVFNSIYPKCIPAAGTGKLFRSVSLHTACPEAWIYECTPDGLKRIEYTDTEHYRVTRDFLANPERTFKLLFGET